MKVKFNSAYVWAVGAVVALSATIMNSCSSDDDYDLYQGDELKTYAAVTRAGSESGAEDYSARIAIEAGQAEQTKSVFVSNKQIAVTVKMLWNSDPRASNTQIIQNVTNIDIPQKQFGDDCKNLYLVQTYFPHMPERAVALSDNPRTFITWVNVTYTPIIYNGNGKIDRYGESTSDLLEFTFDVTSYTEIKHEIKE